MPHDPNAQFDHAVLDIIEHSPVGAVPHTPAYQDALTRLHASHQVYADADHKEGHVTARSLATRPSFHPENLAALFSGQIEPAALESNAHVFDRYVQSLPPGLRARAESYRATVAGRPIHHRVKHGANGDAPLVHDPVHILFLVPGAGPHHGIPGNYLYGSLSEHPGSATAPWGLDLHDCDDGAVIYEASSLQEGMAKLEEVLASAPFHMSELNGLGFRAK